MENDFNSLIKHWDACFDARRWAYDKSVEEIVTTCDRGDWLLWLANKLDISLQLITLTKAKCAETILDLIDNQKTIDAINTANQFGLGHLSFKELYKAADNADNFICSPQPIGDKGFNNILIAYLEYYVLSSTVSPDYVPSNTAVIAHFSSKFKSGVKESNLLLTADVCREILGDLIISNINKQIN